jgi:hypothetical protein
MIQNEYFASSLWQKCVCILQSFNPSFKPYAAMLKKAGIIKKADELKAFINEMNFQGRSVDDVRHALKDKFRQQVMDKMTAKGLTDAQKHQKFLKMTERLNGSDKGSLAEEWYRLVHDKDGVPQVSANKADLKRQGISLEGDRRMDLVNGSTMREIKAISGKMGDHDLNQFKDFMELTEKRGQVSKGDKAFMIDNAHYVFTEPAGVKANAQWMRKQLDRYRGNLSFEIFNAKGESKIIDFESIRDLSTESLTKWLKN